MKGDGAKGGIISNGESGLVLAPFTLKERSRTRCRFRPVLADGCRRVSPCCATDICNGLHNKDGSINTNTHSLSPKKKKCRRQLSQSGLDLAANRSVRSGVV